LSGSLVISECIHFSTLLEDPVMVRKIKPPIKKGAVTRPSSSQNGTRKFPFIPLKHLITLSVSGSGSAS